MEYAYDTVYKSQSSDDYNANPLDVQQCTINSQCTIGRPITLWIN